ncbi:MAG: hypothetical protein B6U86_06060 [Candidatus Altiarchaeales archaeon ex4484_43]|nr:MAG: hypothetical protein B6U86_06060 [Candidatus Altiarchaeales archaeon ex4484_43]
MIWVHRGFYYYNYQIPLNADLGSYGILVEADPSGIDTQAVSGFHVIEGIICGNGVCQTGETCENCPEDCGACPMGAVCGNGDCEATETCENCPEIVKPQRPARTVPRTVESVRWVGEGGL